jgi:hypothetical protein
MAVKSYRLREAEVELLSAPVGKTYAVTTIMVCNHSSTDESRFDLHIVGNGDPVGNGQTDVNATKVINNLILAPEETFTFDTEKVVLSEGDRIVIFAQPGVMDDPLLPVGNLELTDLGAVISYLEV